MSQENNFIPSQEGYKTLTPFKLFVKSNFPFIENTYESLDNYGLYCKVVEYLNDVIANENTVESNVTALYNAFVSLNNYVSDYFDNLDVQEEINNKLDDLVTNGVLQELINNRFNDIEENFTEQIQAVANGSPAGVYSTVEELTTANPNHNRIYLVTSDGKWYFWSTQNNSWVAGGQYQSTGISDGAIDINNLSNDLIYNNNTRTIDKDSVISSYKDDTKYKINLSDNLTNIAMSTSNGQINNNPLVNANYVTTTKYIYVPEDFNLFVDADYSAMPEGKNLEIGIFMYDKKFNYIGCLLSNLTQNFNLKRITNTDNTKYVRLRFRYSTDTEIEISTILNNVNAYLEKIYKTTNDIFLTPSENLLNEKNNIDNYYIANTNGNLTYDEQYTTSGPIELKNGESYTIKDSRKTLIIAKNRIRETLANFNRTILWLTDQINNYTYTATEDCYLLISYRKTVTDNMVVKGSTLPSSYIPYYRQLPDDIDLSNILTPTNILTGKKYVALGDSFTHGDFTNSPTNDYTIESGKYAGEYKVYPYIIGNRNNMSVVNLAANGSKISYINTENLINDIPSDVDYITIKYGINDAPDHQNTPLGTISDNTNDTFYGAWNIAMTNLITNFPNAKIGIIVTNGLSDINYVNAIIAITKKYGIAYLNETTDNKVPLLIRTLRTDVDSSIKALRDNYWEVNPQEGNAHPNAKSHLYESTIVENFLKSL